MGTLWGFLVGWKQCGYFTEGVLTGTEAVWRRHGVSSWGGSSVGTSRGFFVGWKQCGDFMGFLSRVKAVWELHGVSYWDGSSVGTSWGFLLGWKQCTHKNPVHIDENKMEILIARMCVRSDV